jgi:predicted MFS family arabinose efflux permease
MPTRALLVLMLAYVLNFVDRQLVGILGQPIKAELHLSDTGLGLLGGFAFAIFYSVLGLPIARLAERRNRVTIIAVSLGLWSAMTALSGFASGFATLLLARIGVGVGEAGSAAPSQALIADLVPRERRATALALFSLGVPIGMMISAIGGGWIAATLGWRAAFIALGLPGILLAIFLPRLIGDAPHSDTSKGGASPPPFTTVLGMLARDRGFLHMAAGATLASFAGYGVTTFAVPLMMREGIGLRSAATGFGLLVGLALTLGMAGGGWLSDRLSKRDPGAPGRISSLGATFAGILFLVALRQHDPVATAALSFAPFVFAHVYFGPTYAVTVNAVPPAARATAIAILLLAMNAIGLGLGPLLVGMASDHFAHHHGATKGLKIALRLDMIAYFWAGAHFLAAAKTLRTQRQRTAR